MLFRDNDYLIYDTVLGLRGDDLSSESLASMNEEWSITIDCYPETKMLIPVMMFYPEKGSINLSSFYKKTSALGKNMVDVLLKMKIWSGMTEEIAKTLVQIASNIHVRTERQTISKDISQYLYDSPETVSAYNQQKAKAAFDYGATLAQKDPSDKLYYMLPSDFLVTNALEQNDLQFPQMTQVCNPYPNLLYMSWDIGRILDAPVDRRITEINRAINRLSDAGFNFAENEKKLANSFKVIPAEYVFGDPLNDDLEIQDNEQDFYNSFVAFIKHHILLFNKEVMVNASVDVVKEKSEEDFNTGNLPKRLEIYLAELLYTVTRYHYHHVGTFQISKNLFTDPDATDTNEDESMEIGFTDERRESEPPIVIKGYIDLSARTYGASLWAEAIVKLSRWGDRKPATLILGKDNPNVIDLKTMKMRTAALNLARLDKVVDSKGRSFFVNGITPAVYLNDGFGCETPAVVVIYEAYRNPANPAVEEKVFMSVSTQEIIQEYKSGNHFIANLDFDGVEFSTTDDSVRYLAEIEPSVTGGLKSYISDSLITMSHKHQISKINGLGYALLNRDNMMSYLVDFDENFDPVAYLATFTPPERANVLYGFWLSNFDKTAKELEADDFIDYLNDYLELIAENFIKNAAGLVESTVTATALATSSVFSEIPETDDIDKLFEGVEAEIEEGDKTMHRIYKGNVDDLVFIKINNVKQEKPGTPLRYIGAYAKTPQNIIVFASPEDKVKVDPLQPPVTFVQVGALLLGAAVGAFSNTTLDTTPEVVSETTLERIYKCYWGL